MKIAKDYKVTRGARGSYIFEKHDGAVEPIRQMDGSWERAFQRQKRKGLWLLALYLTLLIGALLFFVIV